MIRITVKGTSEDVIYTNKDFKQIKREFDEALNEIDNTVINWVGNQGKANNLTIELEEMEYNALSIMYKTLSRYCEDRNIKVSITDTHNAISISRIRFDGKEESVVITKEGNNYRTSNDLSKAFRKEFKNYPRFCSTNGDGEPGLLLDLICTSGR